MKIAFAETWRLFPSQRAVHVRRNAAVNGTSRSHCTVEPTCSSLFTNPSANSTMYLSVSSTISLLLLCSVSVAQSSCTTSTVTLHAWPLSSPKPAPLASLQRTACGSEPPKFSLSSWTPPPHQSSEYDLVRVGHYDSAIGDIDKSWDGILTSASSLAPGRKKVLTLHTDSTGKIAHVGLGASSVNLSAGQEEVEIQVKQVEPGPKPFLNKPVVLDETGKLKTEQKDERTFIQK